MSITEILCKYTNGELSLEDANKKLEEIGSSIYIDPNKNVITEEEARQTTVGVYADMANGYGLLDTGTGSLDKVQVKDGVLVNCDCGNMMAFVSIAGKTYEVNGQKLVD